MVQDPELTVELDELEGRTGAVTVVVVVWREREKGTQLIASRGIWFR